MKKNMVIIIITFLSISYFAYPWSKDTHRAITKHIEWSDENNGIMNDYLKNLGFSDGRKTVFQLSSPYYFPSDFQSHLLSIYESMRNDTDDDFGTAFNWLKAGSSEEDGPDAESLGPDVPLSARAKNHFHDPTNLQGLNDEETKLKGESNIG